MTRNILVMKHGNVKRGFYQGDQSYELKDKGKRNAQRIGVWLALNNLIPDYVLYSDAEYVRISAEKTCKAAGVNLKLLKAQEYSYAATEEQLIESIKVTPITTNCLLLVGHNPTLEFVLSALSKETIPKTKKSRVLSPAALVHFKIDCDWSEITEQCAELINIIYPKALPELFPYPDVNGTERRIRPAYYYEQSCAIPYRIKDNQIEILIISSSTKRHWLVPKGIQEPGLTAQDSANAEAYEEAGVIGQVFEKELAKYEYPKWEAICKVSVFLMKVSQVLNEHEWPESNRQRRWVQISEAVELIHNADLASIIASVPHYLEQNVA